MKKRISIIGGGSAAIFLANALDGSKFSIQIIEHNAALGRKFLVAGDGGLNLTHSEEKSNFIKRYTPSDFLSKAFDQYDNRFFMDWLEARQIPVFVGTSGRVFPIKGIKPVEVLQKLFQGIPAETTYLWRHDWKGFVGDKLQIEHLNETKLIESDCVVFCLGGASWPVTGSTGAWAEAFLEKHILVNAFDASNCSYELDWTSNLLQHLQGKPLKNCHLSCGNLQHQGEIVFTSKGLEGSGIYPLSPAIRAQLQQFGKSEVFVDLKPSNSPEDLFTRFAKSSFKGNYTDKIKDALNLSAVQMQLLKFLVAKDEFVEPSQLFKKIKALPFIIKASGPLDDAISSVGGIDLKEINENFELKKLPGNFVIGEMLDYDAPTGGYLLQSCFSMAMFLADHLNNKFKS